LISPIGIFCPVKNPPSLVLLTLHAKDGSKNGHSANAFCGWWGYDENAKRQLDQRGIGYEAWTMVFYPAPPRLQQICDALGQSRSNA
jgi:hypothetical protein